MTATLARRMLAGNRFLRRNRNREDRDRRSKTATTHIPHRHANTQGVGLPNRGRWKQKGTHPIATAALAGDGHIAQPYCWLCL